VEKMHDGTPLMDADRLPWLRKIAKQIDSWRARGESGVLTCPALKRSYRDIIIGNRPNVTLIYLKGSYDLVRRRMTARRSDDSCRPTPSCILRNLPSCHQLRLLAKAPQPIERADGGVSIVSNRASWRFSFHSFSKGVKAKDRRTMQRLD